MEEIMLLMTGFKNSLLKNGQRKVGGNRSWIVDGRLKVLSFGITSKSDDIRIARDFYRSIAVNANRKFNQKRFYTKSSQQRTKYAIFRFLSDAEYRNSFAKGKPREARAVSAKQMIEFEENRRRQKVNKKNDPNRRKRKIRRVDQNEQPSS